MQSTRFCDSDSVTGDDRPATIQPKFVIPLHGQTGLVLMFRPVIGGQREKGLRHL
jgi:hypothetical protein